MANINFKGKEIVRNHHLTIPYHELVPDMKKGLSKKPSLNDNLIIHGDNLLALKALLPTYAGKVKCIYIDPPYNTGNEKWAYNDNVNSPMMKEWLGKVVDKDDLTRHDKWLCMMMPRLKLLRELLRDDGVIFVSIDDNEIDNLRLLMDETFGEEGFIGNITIKSTPGGRQSSKNLVQMGDYVVVYGKSATTTLSGLPLSEKHLDYYNREDERGKFLTERLRQHGVAEKREDVPTLYFPIYYNKKENKISTQKRAGYNIEVLPILPEGGDGRWIWSKNKVEKDQDFIEIRKVKRNGGYVYNAFFKKYLNEDMTSKLPSIWLENDFRTEIGTKELKEIFDSEKIFSYPKPVNTILRLLTSATSDDDIILDSFAGSGTTAHATLALNKEDGGNRKFILVEMEDYADKITAERVRRVIKGVKTAKDENLKKGLGGSFSYFELGKPIDAERILKGKDLPTFAEMARYIFYTATGEEFNEKKVNEKTGFIGESKEYQVYLLYKPDMEYLKSTALTLERAETLGKFTGKKRLVFAPAKYLDQEHLERYHVDFAQLPFEIYQKQIK